MSSFNKSRSMFTCEPKCERRKPGCHDHCEKYQNERARFDDMKRNDRLATEADAYTREMVAKRKNEFAIRNKDRGKAKWRRGD